MKIINPQVAVILIFIFLALQERSFTVARPVKKVTHVVTTKNENSYLSSQKGIVGVEKFARIGGRKMRKNANVNGKSKKKSYYLGHRNGDEEEDQLMAFASDYHPPKPHPPKNN